MSGIGIDIAGFLSRHPQIRYIDGVTHENMSEEEYTARLRHEQREAFINAQLSAIPPRFRSASWDDYEDPDAFGRLAVESGRNVVLIGKTGTGKTHAAAAAAVECMGRGMSVGWLNTAKWLYMMRESFGGDMRRQSIRSFEDKQLVVIDDIGVENQTEWASETLNVLINSVYEAGSQTFVTSNLTVPDLAKRLGPRVAGRVVEESEIITCDGPNVRLTRGRK